ncbi:MAG TPA: aminotransferase class I/II-fold pyridoxal phosphate-dependent enzyme [Gemmatimonadaceae bacterium]|jgi:aspartate aminotransferase|nr:aminotransferase class I/II-fold pyridoxal phosphate-dependent enzyme [Gemmatimonadaceae bacterium]
MHPLDQISFGKIVQIRERLLQAQAAGQTVYRLESGDPNFSPAPHVLDAVDRAARAGKTHYIPNDGIPELRAALAEKLRTKNNISWAKSDYVFLTNGAMHGLFVTFSCLLEHGDEVIIPDPMWTEVAENIRLAGGVPVGVPLRAQEDFEYRPSEIEARITPKTKAIFINTPQNPTGAVLSDTTLREIIAIAKRHNLWIVSDEAYEDVIYLPAVHHSIASFAPEYAEKIITLFSFSKSHAMSGLRTGYIVTCDPVLLDRIPKLLRCTINGVNSLAQWAAVAAVTGPQDQLTAMRDEYLVRRDTLIHALEGIPGVRPFTPKGSFFVWAELDPSLYTRLNVADADGVSALLAARGIGSAPGDAFGQTCADAIRFSFSCATPMVEAGAAALRTALTA